MRQTLDQVMDKFTGDLPYPDYNMGLLPDEPGFDVDKQFANYQARETHSDFRKAILEWAAYKIKDARPSTYVEIEEVDDPKWQGRVEAVDEYSRNLFNLLKREGYER